MGATADDIKELLATGGLVDGGTGWPCFTMLDPGTAPIVFIGFGDGPTMDPKSRFQRPGFEVLVRGNSQRHSDALALAVAKDQAIRDFLVSSPWYNPAVGTPWFELNGTRYLHIGELRPQPSLILDNQDRPELRRPYEAWRSNGEV